MATHDRGKALTPEEARRRIAETSFRREGRDGHAGGIGKVGLEPECFPIRTDADGRPAGRLPLGGPGGVTHVLDELASRSGPAGMVRARTAGQPHPPSFDLANGGRVTFEPGGQIEHSTKVHDTGAAALHDAREVTELLASTFAERGTTLAFLGLDLWHSIADVPQQLDAPRYHCMASYFDKRGEGGRTMMRMTASMQVNLDLGPPGVAEERWLLANLASPLATATFASSPLDGPNGRAVSGRAQAWQALDVTRTGYPRPLVEGVGGTECDVVLQWTDAALSADVMIFWREDGTSTCGTPGFTFGQWMAEGHPGIGWPTFADLDYHLTTLFFEVRLRGFLELRAIEAVPPRLRAAPTVILSGLLYDAKARADGLGVLEGVRPRLPELWRRSAQDGLADDELWRLTTSVWKIALEGAHRLPAGFFTDEHLRVAAQFLECCTQERRAPVDAIRAALESGPAEALAWASGIATESCGN
jgi:glutamate--cysteine ligase